MMRALLSLAHFGGRSISPNSSGNTSIEGTHVARKPQLVRNTAAPTVVWIYQFVAVQLFRLSARVRRKVMNAGAIANYVSWVIEKFGDVKVFPNKEKLWELMAQRVSTDDVRGFEFGVAFGYSTDWWLKRLPNASLRWDGFDRFTGLPRAWRFLDAGAFDAGGRTPDIDDQRVTWHVGELEDRLADLTLERSETQQRVILFDLDIFEPSLAAWEYIRDSLRRGDLLYFDEAFDDDERRLLDEHILSAGKYECVGMTPTGLGLQVMRLDPR